MVYPLSCLVISFSNNFRKNKKFHRHSYWSLRVGQDTCLRKNAKGHDVYNIIQGALLVKIHSRSQEDPPFPTFVPTFHFSENPVACADSSSHNNLWTNMQTLIIILIHCTLHNILDGSISYIFKKFCTQLLLMLQSFQQKNYPVSEKKAI